MVALINTDVVAWTWGGQTGAQGEEMETMSVQTSFQTLRPKWESLAPGQRAQWRACSRNYGREVNKGGDTYRQGGWYKLTGDEVGGVSEKQRSSKELRLSCLLNSL